MATPATKPEDSRFVLHAKAAIDMRVTIVDYADGREIFSIVAELAHCFQVEVVDMSSILASVISSTLLFREGCHG